MSWRTSLNYNGHPGAPPARPNMPPVTVNRMTLARVRTITTTNVDSTDSDWSPWGYVNVAEGLDWLLPGYSTTAGSSFTKTEVMIQTAAGIGRPWKIIWRDRITNHSTGVVTYSSDDEQLLLPGDSASRLYDAADGTTLQLESAAVLIPADGE